MTQNSDMLAGIISNFGRKVKAALRTVYVQRNVNRKSDVTVYRSKRNPRFVVKVKTLSQMQVIKPVPQCFDSVPYSEMSWL